MLPERIAILGGGAIGCELGQAFRRFGAEVTILHNGARILARDDADAAMVLQEQLVSEGIRIVTNAHADKITTIGGEKTFHMADGLFVMPFLLPPGAKAMFIRST